MGILQDIYNEQYIPTTPLNQLPESLKEKQWAFYDEIEKVMGVEFMEKHWDILCEVERFRDFANFREGFRLGVSLMLEML